MKTYRVICSQTPDKKSPKVDFSLADSESNISHSLMGIARIHATPGSKILLSHIMLDDNYGNLNVYFTPEVLYKITDKDIQSLKNYIPLITSSYQKWKNEREDSNSTLNITSFDTNSLYSNPTPKKYSSTSFPPLYQTGYPSYDGD